MCQVKVIVKGQILNKQLLDIMSCPLYNSYANGRISFQLGWHIHLTKGMCRVHVAHGLAQGQVKKQTNKY